MNGQSNSGEWSRFLKWMNEVREWIATFWLTVEGVILVSKTDIDVWLFVYLIGGVIYVFVCIILVYVIISKKTIGEKFVDVEGELRGGLGGLGA